MEGREDEVHIDVTNPNLRVGESTQDEPTEKSDSNDAGKESDPPSVNEPLQRPCGKLGDMEFGEAKVVMIQSVFRGKLCRLHYYTELQEVHVH